MSDLFRRYGIKRTEQREALLKILTESKVPMTAEEIFKNTIGISLATVYRTLEIFCEKGVLVKFSVGKDEKKYYEPAREAHRHYAVCLGCGRMEHVDVCPVHGIKLRDFEVTGHRLELYGYCAECKKSESSPSACR